MANYKITKTTYVKIDFKADNDKDMLMLYKVGEVDATLADKNQHQHYFQHQIIYRLKLLIQLFVLDQFKDIQGFITIMEMEMLTELLYIVVSNQHGC